MVRSYESAHPAVLSTHDTLEHWPHLGACERAPAHDTFDALAALATVPDEAGPAPCGRRSGRPARDGASRARHYMYLDGDRRKVEVAGLLECQDGDREVLDREPGGVEERDVPIGEPTARLADQHLAEFCDICTSERARLHGLSQFASVAGLF